MAERDGFKPLAQLLEPDIRNTFFSRINPETGEDRPNTLEDHYTDIEHYALHGQVPDVIATQYDVARNLFAYAWFEYRFFNVAEAKVLTVLEFVLKERIGDEAINAYIKQRKKQHKAKTGKNIGLNNGLKTLIEYCRDHHLIKNEGFSAWHRRGSLRAYERAIDAAMSKMRETGKESVTIDTDAFSDLPPDENYDHIQHLIDHTNKIRNIYAHGSAMLHNRVLYSFELVSEFINQLYPVAKQISGTTKE